MRKASELKFHPIKFAGYGINGSAGSRNPDEFFRSSLPQNICYCVRNVGKTVNEIADDLGVSPVYVETEVDILEEYGFLIKQNDQYLINFCINEPTAELLTMQNDVYKKAAELFAKALSDYAAEGKLRCALVGTQSYGKGSVQTTDTSPFDSGAIKITVAKYTPPSGISYDGVGITPDHVIELPEAHAGKSPLALSRESDTQLGRAIEALLSMITND